MAHADHNQSSQVPRGGIWAMLGLWVALVVLLLGFFLLATRACGLSALGGAVSISHCPPPPSTDPRLTALQQERLRERALQERLDRLRLALVAAPSCPASIAPELAEAAPETGPDAEPVPAPDIPEEAWDERDIDVLEGCWERVSNMVIDDVDTGEIYPVQHWEMCFAADGTGEQRLEFENGAVCSGAIEAEFLPDGRLRIHDLGDVPCDDGRAIYAHIAECTRLPDGTAECIARQPEIGRSGIPSTFRR